MAPLIPPQFAVVGTGRCGTGYAAAALRRCGVKCGHENWWGTDPKRIRGGLDGDSSWLALPHIEAGEWSGPVIHITRHPVAVVRSFIGLGFPGPEQLEHQRALTDLPQPRQAVELWLRWNRRCATVADLTVPVEDFTSSLGDIADVIGRRLDHTRAATVPRDVNHRRRADTDEAEIWRLLDGRAQQFGYREGQCG